MNELIAAVIGAISTIIAALMGVWFGRRPPRENPKISSSSEAKKRSHKYDVFVSTPIAGYATDKKIKRHHDRVKPVVDFLENEMNLHVFWAGRKITRTADFEAPDLSAVEDVNAIRDSRYFLLLYPERICSSVLFEAGIALRCCLVSIYVIGKNGDLPFLMNSSSNAFTNVRIYRESLPMGVIKLIKKHGVSFFDTKAISSG